MGLFSNLSPCRLALVSGAWVCPPVCHQPWLAACVVRCVERFVREQFVFQLSPSLSSYSLCLARCSKRCVRARDPADNIARETQGVCSFEKRRKVCPRRPFKCHDVVGNDFTLWATGHVGLLPHMNMSTGQEVKMLLGEWVYSYFWADLA